MRHHPPSNIAFDLVVFRDDHGNFFNYFHNNVIHSSPDINASCFFNPASGGLILASRITDAGYKPYSIKVLEYSIEPI